ncbi:DUF2188 domain-containing protein [Paenibacillus cymbidii]|uniref:DUF2188 domain-containing protein n=1 Tax=Paenibacillus cymbidii TaxID=1639034 RepID=UPI001080F575|nr:DUF2188 domain-containing protein [Paenibacillus cymbidii]
MPWTKRDYPDSLKNFDARTRGKAVEIANALLDEGYGEGRAIAIATAQAKEWARDHPEHRDEPRREEMERSGSGYGGSDGRRRHNWHVVPHDDGWALKAEGEDEPEQLFETKADASHEARMLASDANRSAIIHRKDGTVERSHNYS